MKWTLRSLALVFMLTGLIASALSQVGTYTGLSGFWDYQTNYRTNQYIRICPNTYMVHVIMMVADDSLNPSTSRRTAYAFSSNGGWTWNRFNEIRVPPRRSGFPSLDIGQGPNSCYPIISNHSTIGGSLQSTIFVDAPPGGGAFTEIVPPSSLGGDDPGFPEVAGAADGSVILLGSRFAAGSLHVARTADFISWSPWGTLTPDFVSDGFVTEANTTGRVGVAVATPEGPLLWYESTNNGATWPATPTQLLPDLIPVGNDTYVIQQGIDFVYLDGDTLVSFGVTKLVGGVPTQRDQGIGFWSEHTGFVLAVPHNSVTGAIDTLLKRQVNQNTVGYPAIGLSGSTIVIAFQAYMRDTSASGFNYADVFYTTSRNRGITWSQPMNISSSRFVDERYPSISKWNFPDVQPAIVYQQDSEPGSAAFGDGAPLSRVRQMFCRIGPIISVDPTPNVPQEFTLSQNYPNPFNPTTSISFTISHPSFVTLKVYNLLGQEMRTLVGEMLDGGRHRVEFNAEGLPSGVYVYRIQSGSNVATRKMVFLK